MIISRLNGLHGPWARCHPLNCSDCRVGRPWPRSEAADPWELCSDWEHVKLSFDGIEFRIISIYFYILVSSCISITTPTFTIDWALRTVIALAGLGYVTWITIRCEDWGGQAFQIVLGEQVRTMLWEDGWSMFNQQGLEPPEALQPETRLVGSPCMV